MSHVVRRRPDARLILLLGALAACGPIATDMYLPSLPSIADGFSVSAGAAQRTLTSFMAGFSVGMLLYGPLSDTWGRRPVLLGGIALFTLASIGCFVSGSTRTSRPMRQRCCRWSRSSPRSGHCSRR